MLTQATVLQGSFGLREAITAAHHHERCGFFLTPTKLRKPGEEDGQPAEKAIGRAIFPRDGLTLSQRVGEYFSIGMLKNLTLTQIVRRPAQRVFINVLLVRVP